MGYKLKYNHYIGPSKINNMAAGAEKNIDQWTYTEEKRKWTFEKYSTLHKEKHNIIESLKEHGYTVVEQLLQVRYLNEGIKTTGLNSVKTRIMSDESLSQDFDKCVTLYKEFSNSQAQMIGSFYVLRSQVQSMPV